jgi:hypothetical protein
MSFPALVCQLHAGCAALFVLESVPVHERTVVSGPRPNRRSGRGPMECPARYRFDADSHPVLFW